MQTSSNDIKPMVVMSRGVAGLVAAAVVGSWLWGVVARTGRAWGSGQPARADELLAALAATAALILVAWLTLGLALGLLARVPGSLGRAAVVVADVVTPRLMRRTAAFVLGVGVVAGLAPGASVAAPSHPTVAMVTSADPDAVATALPDPGFRALPDPGWVPDAPTVRPQADVSVLSRAPATTAATPVEVVVQRGDTLWGIAARHLGPGASDAEIATAWPAWFAENRAVVGDDPDLILPGQVLRAPQVVAS
jgi:nucleoid-associated protein YgaU